VGKKGWVLEKEEYKYISGVFLYPKQVTQKVVQKLLLAVSGLVKGRSLKKDEKGKFCKGTWAPVSFF